MKGKNEKRVSGHVSGVRDGALEELNRLYEMKTDRQAYISPEALDTLAHCSAALGREAGIYLSREGEVLDVKLGTADRLSGGPEQGRRRRGGLSGVRCVHTHPNGNPMLSEPDLSMMRRLKMDSVCAAGIDTEGNITGLCAAFFDGNGEIETCMLPSAEELNRMPWQRRIREAQDALAALPPQKEDGKERAILVSLDAKDDLDELAALAEAGGAEVVKRVWQNRPGADSAYYIGPGKADEIALDAQNLDADVIIFDDELSGKQLRNLEDRIGVKIVDRTTLILDIFAQRAVSEEGKLQVAAAQARYRSAKLIGQGLVLSRLGGGIGTRGPGETQLEMDRRLIRRQLRDLEERLEKLEQRRGSQRKQRERNEIPVVALVGYTNTGKSTLMNRMSGAGVLVKDQLFATLDAVGKRIEDRSTPYILVDTVGFIDKLPHDLVKAFRSTLEEAALADVLVIVSDLSDPRWEEKRRVVQQVLEDLGATEQPRIEVLNKCDRSGAPTLPAGSLCMSALTGEGLEAFREAVLNKLRRDERTYSVFVPWAQFSLASRLEEAGRVLKTEDTDEGRRMTLSMKEKDMHQAEKNWGLRFETV